MQIIIYISLGLLGIAGLRALRRVFLLLDNAYENWLDKKIGIKTEVVIMADGDFAAIVGNLIAVGIAVIVIYGVVQEVL